MSWVSMEPMESTNEEHVKSGLNMICSAYDSDSGEELVEVSLNERGACRGSIGEAVAETVQHLLEKVEADFQTLLNGEAKATDDRKVTFTSFRGTRNEEEIDVSSSSSCSLSSSEDEASGSEEELVAEHKDDPESQIAKRAPKTKGELSLDELPPIETLSIEAKVEDLLHVGRVVSLMDRLVSVQSFRGSAVLDLDSVLFLKDGLPLGSVFDVFGPVVEPRYLVRFNTSDEIIARKVAIDTPVYFAPSFEAPVTAYVFMEQLRRMKGSDASWKHNNEPPEEVKEFSDDEEERRVKMKVKGKSRNKSVPFASPSSLRVPPNTPDTMSEGRSRRGGRGYRRNGFNNNWFASRSTANSQNNLPK